MIFEAMARARNRGITTAFAVRGFGYYEARHFDDVDHAFTCSQFLTDHYRDRVGLVSTPIEPPIDWSATLAPEESRAFVTFVNPSAHKGLLLFARLADMLGSQRPDIPILVVQSGHSGGSLNAIPGLDFSRYPQIMAAPPVPAPKDYFALTRILVAPSVWEEPFGRVAAEAMINAIPRARQRTWVVARCRRRRFQSRWRRTRPADSRVDDVQDDAAAERAGNPALVRGRLYALGRSGALPLRRDASATDCRRAIQ
jgi:hypothetical protein